ncbi:MAG: flippase [Anaerolineae bacterium]|nr:flippase [Anaerolineae bacterium]
MGQSLGLRQLAKDSTFNLLRQGWSIFLGLATSVLLARGLGAEDRGIYAVAILLPTLLVTLLNGGVGSSLVYYVARAEYSLAMAIQAGFLFAFVSSLLGIAVGLFMTFVARAILFPGVSVDLMLLSLAIVPIVLHRDNFVAIFQGLQDFRAYNLVGIIPQFSILVLTFLFIWVFKLGVSGAIAAVILGNLLSLLMVFVILNRRSPNTFVSWQLQRESVFQMLKYGLKVHASNVVSFLNYRADIFLLNLFASKMSVGIYDVAVSLSERLWILASAVSTVVFPRVASLRDDEDKRRLTPVIARYVFWFSLAMAALSYVIVQPIIVLVFGEEFRAAALAFQVLLPGIIMGSVSKIIANDIAGRGTPGINSIVATLAALINIIANLLLIPYLDFIGSAIATSISYTSLTVILVIYFCRISDSRWTELVVPTRADVVRVRQVLSWLIARLKRV